MVKHTHCCIGVVRRVVVVVGEWRDVRTLSLRCCCQKEKWRARADAKQQNTTSRFFTLLHSDFPPSLSNAKKKNCTGSSSKCHNKQSDVSSFLTQNNVDRQSFFFSCLEILTSRSPRNTHTRVYGFVR